MYVVFCSLFLISSYYCLLTVCTLYNWCYGAAKLVALQMIDEHFSEKTSSSL